MVFAKKSDKKINVFAGVLLGIVGIIVLILGKTFFGVILIILGLAFIFAEDLKEDKNNTKENNKQSITGFSGDLWLYLIFCILVGLFFYGALTTMYGNFKEGEASLITLIMFIIVVINAIFLVISVSFIHEKKRLSKLFSIITMALLFVLMLITIILGLQKSEFTEHIGGLLFYLVGSVIWIFYFFVSEKVKKTLTQ